MNKVSASIAHASWSTASRFTVPRFTTYRFTASRLTASRSIASRSTAYKYSSNLARSWPRSVSPNTLNFSIEVHLWVHTISAFKCISKLAQSRPPSASLSRLNLCLQVHLQTRSITVSKYIFTARRRVFSDTGATKVNREMGSIYSADPGVYRHHPISISSYHTMEIHTLSFPTFGLTRTVRDFVDPWRQVVSHLLTRFLPSSHWNRSFSWIQFICSVGVSRGSSDHAQVPSAARLTVCI